MWTPLKTLCIASVSSLAGIGAVAAADLYTPPPTTPAPMETSTFAWAGPYAGFQLGWGWGSIGNSFDVGSGPVSQPAYSADGLIAGVQGGMNWQNGNYVYGFEGDITYAGLSGNDGGLSLVTDSFDGNWMASVRPRIGYAWDKFLFYGTGGLAILNYDYSLSTSSFSESHNQTALGWTIGAGVEAAINPTWTVRTEYRYSDFGSQNIAFAGGSGVLPQTIAASPTVSTFTVGVNHKF
jgi:outer membrane immunogenic protein